MLKSTGLFLYLKLKGCDFLPHLIITEKPSVARTISKVLGVTARRDGYLEGGGYLISWCAGHLVELAPPGAYDPRLERWDRADLPILPERWQYLVSLHKTSNCFLVELLTRYCHLSGRMGRSARSQRSKRGSYAPGGASSTR